ncbi:MAG: hypothetical protein ACP5JG_02500 [Anaerolineae bacterium]
MGYFAPWVARRPMTAGLAWNAYDLFDLLRLLPSIETGALTVNLHALRLPLIGLALMLPALMAETGVWFRVAGGGLACGLAATTLPPYPEIINAWHTPGWQVPFWWGIGSMAVSLITIWLAPKMNRYLHWWLLAVAMIGSCPAAVTYARLRPALQELHAAHVGAGWGFWVYLINMSAIGLVVWYETLRSRL